MDRERISADDVALIKMYFCRRLLKDEHIMQYTLFSSLFSSPCGSVIQNLGQHPSINIRPRVVATAIMYFRRFYTVFVFHLICYFCLCFISWVDLFSLCDREDFSKHDPLLIAPVCFFLACKADECQIPASKVTETMMKLVQGFGYAVKALVGAEYEVLRAIDYHVVVFDVYTELKPLLVSCGLVPSVAALEGQPLGPVCAAVWSAANDSYILTDAALLFPPHVVALACIVVGACVMHNVDLRWWFSTLSRRPDLESDMRHVWEVVSAMLDGYRLWGRLEHAPRALEKLSISRPVPPLPQGGPQQADRRP